MRYVKIEWESTPPRALSFHEYDTPPQGIRTVNGNPVLVPYVEDDVPGYDPAVERVERTVTISAQEYHVAYDVVALTPEEVDERFASLEAELDTDTVRAIKGIVRGFVVLDELSEEELQRYLGLYPYWRAGVAYAVGDEMRHDDTLYRVIQAHTSQSDWQPPDVPALFALIAPAGTIADWVQPAGAHDAYQIGDRVRHNDKIWECTTADNVWEPGVFGWVEVTP